jgi:hypothetical protein
MLILRQNISIRVPVRLVDANGNPVTGQLPSSVQGAVMTVIHQDGSSTDVNLTNGINWFEIDAVKAPGLYHLLIGNAQFATLGPAQVSLVPAALNTWQTSITSFVVENIGAKAEAAAQDAKLARQVASGNWVVSNNQLKIYDDNFQVLYTFDLLDDQDQPTMTKIFKRSQPGGE